MAQKDCRASSPLVFRTVEEAEAYWEKNLAGQHKDSDDDIAAMERWIETVRITVRIEEVENDVFNPSIAKLQAEAMSRGHSNYPPGFDSSRLD